jgi:hypothetical protein
MNLQQIESRIGAIKQELSALGPMHPGSVSEQYNICGTPGCRCKDPKKPRKHGPYYQLSYTLAGRHGTRFVRPDQLAAIREKVNQHRRFRELVKEWVALCVEQERWERERVR